MSVPLTAERLREVLDFNPETGIFKWKVTHNRIKRGQIAGTPHPAGYRRINLNQKLYYAHRLAWLYVNGIVPPQQVDHINGDRADNRIVNLRLCDNSLNQQNRSLKGAGTTGFLGVSFDKKAQKFESRIESQGLIKFLGYFDTAIEAHQAYLDAKKTIHQFQGWQHSSL